MNRFLTMTLAAVVLSVGSAASASLIVDTVIYADPLDGVSGDLDGTSPADRGGTGSVDWDAISSFKANGSIVVGGKGGAWLPFTPVAGNIYQLSADVNTTGSSNSNQWSTLGFSNAGDADDHFIPQGYATMILRDDRDPVSSTAFTGLGTGGSSNYVPPSGVVELAIVLDATDASAANWTAEYFFDGTSLGTPATAASGSFGDITHAGFSTLSSSAGTVADFQLATMVIPEPVSLAFLALGGVALLKRRPRRR
jgi:hypothetical protein